MPKPSTLLAQYELEAGEDDAIRKEAQDCARVSKPWVFPTSEQADSKKTPVRHQAITARGVTNMGGRILTTMLPMGGPWLQFPVPPEIMHSEDVSDEDKQKLANELWRIELLVQGYVESAKQEQRSNARPQSFRSQVRQGTDQSLITGDVLVRMNDKSEVTQGAAPFSLTNFRRDRYTTRRDDAGNPLWHHTIETIDPMALSDAMLEIANLKRGDFDTKSAKERQLKLVTRCMWNPQTKVWTVCQEINNAEIHESEEQVSPFIPVAYDLAPCEHYGRGFVDHNWGDIFSLDEICRHRKDFCALASKFLVAKDYANTTGTKDLLQENGAQFRARVAGGQIEDIAMFQSNKTGDYSIIKDGIASIEQSLAKAMLLESDSTPDRDRVTRAQVMRIAAENDSASGGLMTPYGDQYLRPIAERAVFMLTRDKVIKPLSKSIELVILTGLTALARSARVDSILTFSQIAASFGEEAIRSIKTDVLLDIVRRYSNIHEPIIKSAAEKQAEQAEAQRQAAIAQGATTTIETAGAIAENRAAAAPSV